mgnify:CR=1 FL=1
MVTMGKTLNLKDSMQILHKYKIPIPKSEMTKTAEQAVKAAKKLGYPVAIKLVSPDITHKTDVGGVRLNLVDDKELRVAYENMLKTARKKFPKTKINGVLVQKMIPDGQEIIIGCKKDEQFGHVLMFGLGGIFTEVFNDVSFKVIPINKNDAEAMVKEIKGYTILQGYRGKKYDVDSLIKILLKVSHLVEKNHKIKEMDINPVILLNKGAVAVDSRIVLG